VTATPPRADLVREGERIRAEIAAHPRAVLIDALADTMHAIEDDMGTGRHINDYLCLAYATVEMLPSLVYDENATCDEPGCGAHPATQVTAIGDAAAAPPAPEQVFVDAAEVYDTTRSAVMRLPVEPPLAEWEREVLAHQDALRAAVASAYRAGQAATPDDVESLPPVGRLVGRGPLKIRQAATPDGPHRWASQVPAEPGPDVLAVQIVETGQRWERRYAKDQPDRWAWGHWLLEWSQLLSWAAGRTLTDATPAADGQDGDARG
jgi:hypothetical protein